MARKNKRSQVRKPQRGGGVPRAVRPGGGAPIVPPATGQESASPAPAAQPSPPAAASSRMVQRPLPRTRGRQIDPFQSADASVPIERVPYFRSDVRRIAITAGLMIVLLIVGSIMLRNMLQA